MTLLLYYVRWKVEQGNMVGACFIDLSKAFDTSHSNGVRSIFRQFDIPTVRYSDNSIFRQYDKPTFIRNPFTRVESLLNTRTNSNKSIWCGLVSLGRI